MIVEPQYPNVRSRGGIDFSEGQQLTIWREGNRNMLFVAGCQLLLGTAAVAWPPKQIPHPGFVAPVYKTLPVWRPERVATAALLRGELGQGAPRQIIGPKLLCIRSNADGYLLAIAGECQSRIAAWR